MRQVHQYVFRMNQISMCPVVGFGFKIVASTKIGPMIFIFCSVIYGYQMPYAIKIATFTPEIAAFT